MNAGQQAVYDYVRALNRDWADRVVALDIAGARLAFARRGKSVARTALPKRREERVDIIVDEWPCAPAVRCWERNP